MAVNRRQSAKAGQQDADYFRVAAWEKLGEICAQYLSKGKKIAVTGSIRAGAYTNSQGQAVGTLELWAEEVEFLSPRQETASAFIACHIVGCGPRRAARLSTAQHD